jgi:hypothetical protein
LIDDVQRDDLGAEPGRQADGSLLGLFGDLVEFDGQQDPLQRFHCSTPR